MQIFSFRQQYAWKTTGKKTGGKVDLKRLCFIKVLTIHCKQISSHRVVKLIWGLFCLCPQNLVGAYLKPVTHVQ